MADKEILREHNDKFYEVLFKQAEPRIKKFYKQYKSTFLKSAMGYEDLAQDCKIKIFQYVEKNKQKSEKDILKIIGKKTRWYLNDKLCRCGRKNKPFVALQNATEIIEKIFNKDGVLTNNSSIKSSNRFQFSDLLVMCTNREYNIIVDRFEHNRTFAEIAVELNMSKQAVHQIYNKTMAKLKRYMKRGAL